MDFDAVINVISNLAERKGLEYELYLFNADILKMEAEKSLISSFTEAISNGFSLRLKKRNKVSFSYASGFEEKKVIDAFNNALDLINIVEENNDIIFGDTITAPINSAWQNNLGVYSDKFQDIDINLKKKNLIEMEEIAYAYDKKVFKIDKPSYSEVLFSKRVVNSNGLDLISKKTHYEIFLSAASKNNEENGSGFDFDYSPDFDSLKFKKIAMNAAKRAVDQLGAKIIESGKYKILFDNITSSEFLSILKQSFFGSSIYKKKSLLEGKIDKKVFSDKLTIIDDGSLYGGYSTDAFDAEGVKTDRKIVCLNGVIKSFLYDIEYANKFHVKPTGNGIKHSHTAPPEVGSTNFFIDNGQSSVLDIISSIKNGLYITELMGIHMAKPYSGEFSLGASGFYIKNGEIDFPIKGIVISGNLIQLYNSISDIAGDRRFFGSIGSPSILFENIQVSGK